MTSACPAGPPRILELLPEAHARCITRSVAGTGSRQPSYTEDATEFILTSRGVLADLPLRSLAGRPRSARADSAACRPWPRPARCRARWPGPLAGQISACSIRAPRRSRAPPGPPRTPRPARRTAPSAKPGPSRRAASTMSRLFPTPPEPVRVTSRTLPRRPGLRWRRPPARGPAAAWAAPEGPRPAAGRPRRLDAGSMCRWSG